MSVVTNGRVLSTGNRDLWPAVFRGVGAAIGVGVSALLLVDVRPSATVDVAVAFVGSVSVLVVSVRVDRPVRAITGTLLYVAAALLTYPYGGLAYLMSAIMLTASATVSRWPHRLVRVVRVLICVVSVPLLFSVGGAGIFTAPITLALLAWSSSASRTWTRYLTAVVGGLVAFSVGGMLPYLVGRPGAWLAMATACGAAGIATLAFVLPRWIERRGAGP